jgi:hypothetical protein
LESKVANDGIILTEAQVQALEKKKLDDEAWGEIETSPPGYLGSSAPKTHSMSARSRALGGFISKPISRHLCQGCSGQAPHHQKPITAADMLNDKVLPFYEEHGLPVLRILTDRRMEYCGRVDMHDYQLFLAINDIDYIKTKVKSPQTNVICEWFHKTILQESYQIAFRKKVYVIIEALQNDMDEWIEHYNNERTYQGKVCEGLTPMQALEDGKPIWKEKFVDQI